MLSFYLFFHDIDLLGSALRYDAGKADKQA